MTTAESGELMSHYHRWKYSSVSNAAVLSVERLNIVNCRDCEKTVDPNAFEYGKNFEVVGLKPPLTESRTEKTGSFPWELACFVLLSAAIAGVIITYAARIFGGN